MDRIRKILILSSFILLSATSISEASEANSPLLPEVEYEINTFKNNLNQNIFSIANIVDSFFNSNDEYDDEYMADRKSQIRREFLSATSKFNSGNASVAYDDYEKMIDKIDNDISLLNLSKIFYEIGFHSLAKKANERIVFRTRFEDNFQDLERSYKPKFELSKDEEIYFAKIYSSIHFDNSANEAVVELIKNKQKYQKNDYYNYMLSKAYLKIKKYSDSINAINKAISINPDNLFYQINKIDILTTAGKYNDAKKLIKKLQDDSTIINFVDTLEIKEQIVLLNNKNDKDKKFHSANKIYLEGNYEKSKKDCMNILNFDKNNDRATALLAKSELASGNIEKANSNFVLAYKENKKNTDAIIGTGDIKYLHNDYKNAVKTYKKVYKEDKENYEAIIKLAIAHREYGKKPKELKKLELKLDKIPKNRYIDYYKSAISIAQKNSVLKEDLLKKALTINPLYENAVGELIQLHLQNKNFELAKNLIYNASFTLQKNYYYYYLCGLYNQALNKKQEAVRFYKTSLSLNPAFEIANIKLLKLIPTASDEEI